MTNMTISHRFRWLNNIKVRNKLLMIYILCIVVPVLVTNLVFVARIINSVKRENLDQCNGIMDTVQLNVSKEFEKIINLSTLIYTDRSLDTALEKDYTSSSQKIYVFYYFKEYMARIRSMYTQIDQLTLYTDNTTIPYAGINLINNIPLNTMDWHKTLSQSGKAVLFYTYTQEGTKYLSVIRNMNYFYDSKMQKIVKIDLNFGNIAGYLKNKTGRWDVYLVNSNDEVVISSNDSINKQAQFVPFETISSGKNEVLITRDLGRYNVLQGWRLVGVFRQDQLYESLQQSWGIVAGMAMLTLCVVSFVIMLISWSLNTRLKLVSSQMKQHTLEQLLVAEGADEIGEVIREYNIMVTKLNDMIKNEYEYSIDLKNAELERKQAVINALQSQINPHFLFNTLDTIRMHSIIKDETETAQIIKSLSMIFRRMLAWKEDLIPLRDELSFVEDYLKIQRYRFGDKVDYRINVQSEAEEIRIPKMALQPLVENACIHGLEGIISNGCVTVEASIITDQLRIMIQDNGKGMDYATLKLLMSQLDTQQSSDTSIGIRNVYNRLKLRYGDQMTFDIKSDPGMGTVISISLPLPLAEEE